MLAAPPASPYTVRNDMDCADARRRADHADPLRRPRRPGRPGGHKATLLHVEATVKLRVERERQQWRRGLLLLDLTARADAVVVLDLDVDASVGLDRSKVPPEVVVKPTVTRTQLDLKEFE